MKLCAKAAKNGHLNILIFLHQNRCPWNELTCREAAENSPSSASPRRLYVTGNYLINKIVPTIKNNIVTIYIIIILLNF